MKTLLISLAILLALSSTVYAERYSRHDRGYNNHHISKYESNHGKYNTKPFKYSQRSIHNGKYNRYDRYISNHNHHKDNLPVIILGLVFLDIY